jgi:hypothetical protein
MWTRCTWRWKVLVHPHEELELIGALTMRKYDLQNCELFSMTVDNPALQFQLCKQDEINE